LLLGDIAHLPVSRAAQKYAMRDFTSRSEKGRQRGQPLMGGRAVCFWTLFAESCACRITQALSFLNVRNPEQSTLSLVGNVEPTWEMPACKKNAAMSLREIGKFAKRTRDPLTRSTSENAKRDERTILPCPDFRTFAIFDP
jgi:hypothetical protein